MAKDESFTELLEKVNSMPNLFSGARGADAGSAFGTGGQPPLGNHRLVDMDVEGKATPVEWDYSHHCQVFTLPGDEEAYNAVQDQCLRGDALPRAEERSFTPLTGEYRILLTWLTRRRNPEREARLAEEERDADAPPRGRRR